MPDKGQRAKTAIIEAARDLFYHQGYGATSYADIAQETGFGKGNIHYYFNSKEDILRAVTQARMQMFKNVLQEWSLECGTPYDCLERFVDLLANNAENLSKFGCPIGTLNDELGKTNAALQEEARQMFDLFLRWLEARFKALFPPKQAREHAEHLLIMAQGISVLAHAYNDPALVKRQSKIVRRWLKDICKEAQINRSNAAQQAQ